VGAGDFINEPDCILINGSSNCIYKPYTDISGVYWTKDAGTTWNTQTLNWVPTLGIASDADTVIAFGPEPIMINGKVVSFSYSKGARAYIGSLAGCRCNSQELLAVASSDDKGSNWNPPVLATTKDNPVDFNDKDAIWVDQNPSSPFFGNVYVSWTLFIGPLGTSEPIMFSRSTNGGQTFQAPMKLSPAYNNRARPGRQGSMIRTGPDGTVYVFWEDSFTGKSAILGARSIDGGASFSRPFLVSLIFDLPSPLPGASFRINSFPMVDIDQKAGTAGKILVTWADYTSGASSGHGVVKLVKSSDKGISWSSPQIVADVIGRTAFYPSVAVNPNNGSKIFIGFNAIDDKPFGTAPGAGVVFYDSYYVLSTDGGGTFGSAAKISAVSSDPDPSTRNNLLNQFIGDYNGASTNDTEAWFTWTDTRNGATCSVVDTFRSGIMVQPNIYSSCNPNFGNTDIFVAKVPWQ
jgi:hypothetical protein